MRYMYSHELRRLEVFVAQEDVKVNVRTESPAGYRPDPSVRNRGRSRVVWYGKVNHRVPAKRWWTPQAGVKVIGGPVRDLSTKPYPVSMFEGCRQPIRT